MELEFYFGMLYQVIFYISIRSVKDLARLSLKDPLYVSVHEYSTHTTPENLQQNYIVCPLEDKMAMLWSFIRNHLKQKIIVFFSSCKQVIIFYILFIILSIIYYIFYNSFWIKIIYLSKINFTGEIHIRGILSIASWCQFISSLWYTSSNEKNEYLWIILQEAICCLICHWYCSSWIR